MTEANLIFAMKIICEIDLIFFGLLIVAFSYPLIKGYVKMNHAYGVRFPQAFYSDESWHKINAYGGKAFMIWGILVAIAGALFIFIPLDSKGLLFAIFLGIYAAILVPIVITYAYARRFKQNPM